MALICPGASAQRVLLQRNPADVTAPRSDDSSVPQGVEILSDTGGVDIGPYVKQVIATVYKNWVPLLPQEATPPQANQMNPAIRFTILPDGKIESVHLDSSTNDDAINRACWGAITSTGQFPPLPTGMGPKPLELRIHFSVNPTTPH